MSTASGAEHRRQPRHRCKAWSYRQSYASILSKSGALSGHLGGHLISCRLPCQARFAHQLFDSATGDHKALPHHLPPYLRHAIDREVLSEHASDLGLEDEILKVGVTYVRTTRDRVSEAGGPFALTVAHDRQVTGFADAGVTFARNEASDAAFRPYVGFGARARTEGKRADATAGYAGLPLTLTALGAARAQVVGTASAGVAYRLPSGVELFSTVEAQTGQDDHRESVATGVRLRF